MKDLKLFNDKIDYLFPAAFQSTDIYDYLQKDMLGSELANNFLDFVELNINNLYEKSRVLEEVLDQLEFYLNNIIGEQAKTIYNVIDLLEKERDTIKQKLYTQQKVFFDGYTSGNDRDGEPLPSCEIFNNHITSSGKTADNLPISDATVDSNFVCHRNNIKNIIKNSPYRTLYMIDGKAENGIVENITLYFDTPIEFNYFLLEFTNCDLVSIKYINSDNTVTIDNEIYSAYKKNKKVKGIIITLKASNCRIETYEVDRLRMNSNFWNIVNDDIYQSYINSESSILDIEKYSGMAQHRIDYQRYINELNNWEKEKQEVEYNNEKVLSIYTQDKNKWEQENEE